MLPAMSAFRRMPRSTEYGAQPSAEERDVARGGSMRAGCDLHFVAHGILEWDRAAMYPIDIPLALDALRVSARGGRGSWLRRGWTLGQLVERLLRYR
jgi:hypothetical protein